MRCAQCGFESPEGLQFCGQCGTRLTLLCPSCRQPSPPTFRFCGSCGMALSAEASATEAASATAPGPAVAPTAPKSYTPPHLAARILTGRGALEGERKQVTVLFADVANFTAIAERLDPEEVHGVMDRCFRILMDEVHRYEGTINQFTGDGIMALFGAPLALENAPERGLRAALGMQAALRRYGEELQRTRGIQFRMRIGIHTGPVVVGKIGDDLRMDYTAVGDTTNLSARLQQAAAPGTILVSDHTAKLVAGRFVMREAGPLALKGKSQPVTAHEVLRVRARLPLVAPSEHGLTPLVGRSAELATLEARFEQACAGRGQMVFAVGDAGIGKSRLIYEFRRRLAGRDVTWLEGRCVSFAREIPLLPILDVVRASFAIDEADGEATIIEKVRHGLTALSPDLARLEPYVRYVLAVDPGDPAVGGMEAQSRRFAIFDSLKRLMVAGAARRPLVILIEDLHWLDQPSEDYLDFVSEAVATARVLLLCTYRPGYRNPFGERSYATRLALQPLSPEETARMAAAMLETAQFPPELRALVLRKAEGNPFFIEEVTKSLVEMEALRRTPEGLTVNRDLSEIVIPDTIQGVIMARIDRLGDAAKRAIQIASVIGREFAARLLERVADVGQRVDQLVVELRSLELIYEKSGMPELAYMFKHALTHDVAYESLLVQRRKELHRVIGHAVEELYADRLGEYWEVLSHHFYRGEEWRKAFEYLVKAGNKARGAFANREAIYFYGRALEAAERGGLRPEETVAALEAKALAHFCMSEFSEAVEAFDRAVAAAGAGADRGRLLAGKSYALVWAHEFDRALATAEEANAIARQIANPAIEAEGTHTVAFVLAVRGELDRSEDRLAEATRLAAAAGHRVAMARAETFGALLRNWRGDYRAAIERMEPLVVQLRETNELIDLAQVHSHFSITLGGAGEYRRALGLIDETITLCESLGDRVWRARLWNTRGWILGELGAQEAAEEANRRCLEIARQMGASRMVTELIGNAEANLADLALERGDRVGAEPHLAEVAAILSDRRNEWMTWRYGMHHHASAAELALARGDLGHAGDLLAACLEVADRTGSRRYQVRAHRLLAAAAVAAGNLAEAERLLARVVDDARSLGNPPQLWQALLAWGRALHGLGRRDEAARAWRAAFEAASAVRRQLPAEIASAFGGSRAFTTLGELGA